jgi:hypothetical protein
MVALIFQESRGRTEEVMMTSVLTKQPVDLKSGTSMPVPVIRPHHDLDLLKIEDADVDLYVRIKRAFHATPSELGEAAVNQARRG